MVLNQKQQQQLSWSHDKLSPPSWYLIAALKLNISCLWAELHLYCETAKTVQLKSKAKEAAISEMRRYYSQKENKNRFVSTFLCLVFPSYSSFLSPPMLGWLTILFLWNFKHFSVFFLQKLFHLWLQGSVAFSGWIQPVFLFYLNFVIST